MAEKLDTRSAAFLEIELALALAQIEMLEARLERAPGPAAPTYVEPFQWGSPTPSPLTGHEQALLQAAWEGRTYKHFAHEKGISNSAVRSLASSCIRKLDVPTCVQAALVAYRNGWIAL